MAVECDVTETERFVERAEGKKAETVREKAAVPREVGNGLMSTIDNTA